MADQQAQNSDSSPTYSRAGDANGSAKDQNDARNGE